MLLQRKYWIKNLYLRITYFFFLFACLGLSKCLASTHCKKMFTIIVILEFLLFTYRDCHCSLSPYQRSVWPLLGSLPSLYCSLNLLHSLPCLLWNFRQQVRYGYFYVTCNNCVKGYIKLSVISSYLFLRSQPVSTALYKGLRDPARSTPYVKLPASWNFFLFAADCSYKLSEQSHNK